MKCRTAIRCVFLSAMLLAGTARGAVPRSVPDSLLVAYHRLEALVKETRQVSGQIYSPEDMSMHEIELELLDERVKNLVKEHPSLFENEALADLYSQYRACVRGLDEKLQRYRQTMVHDSIARVMERWSPRFDSLLSQGQAYAGRKEADSVRSVKNRADDWWSEVVDLQRSYSSYFAGDEKLRAGYRHIEQVRTQVRELSEKERLHLKDLILTIAVVAGVVVMVIGMIGSRIRNKKLQRQIDDGVSFDI